MVVYGNAEFKFDMARLCRRLRIDGDTLVDENARDTIPQLAEIAKEHADLKALYLVGEHNFETGIPQVDECEKQVICLCYASDKILEIITEMMDGGDYLEGYMLNDLVNDVLFNVSNQLNEELFEKMKSEGRYLTEKYSPGEDDIPLELQKVFLDLFREETDLDVEINDSFMLIPEKAMMYAFGADKDNPEVSVEHDCSKCTKVDCFFRVK